MWGGGGCNGGSRDGRGEEGGGGIEHDFSQKWMPFVRTSGQAVNAAADRRHTCHNFRPPLVACGVENTPRCVAVALLWKPAYRLWPGWATSIQYHRSKTLATHHNPIIISPRKTEFKRRSEDCPIPHPDHILPVFTHPRSKRPSRGTPWVNRVQYHAALVLFCATAPPRDREPCGILRITSLLPAVQTP